MHLAIAIIAVLVVCGIFGGLIINWAGIFLGVPIALIIIGVVVTKEFLDRQAKIMQMKRFRRDARAQKIDFSETDRRTMV
jgi:hypothetical protein